MAMTHSSAGMRAKSAVRRAANTAEDTADDVIDTARGGLTTAIDTMEDALSWAGSKMSALGDRIQEKPLQTAALAVGAGAMLAWLLRR